jgi:hypothetical protein
MSIRNTKHRIITNVKLVRRDVRRIGQILRYRRISLDGVPILFANSFPKSGTHLLTQILHSFSKVGPAVDSGLPAVVTFEGSTGSLREEAKILEELGRFKPGDIGYGHLHATSAVIDSLCRDGVVPYFIIRDPRDVVVSHVHYVTEMEPNHIHHNYYRAELTDFDERLRTSILGRPVMGGLFPDIKERFRPYLEWVARPEVLVLHFEEFINSREKTIEKVIDHAVQRSFPLGCKPDTAIRILSAGIHPEKSPTFRHGKAGGWRKNFSSENKQLFKEVAGDLLIQLGYERSDDW